MTRTSLLAAAAAVTLSVAATPAVQAASLPSPDGIAAATATSADYTAYRRYGGRYYRGRRGVGPGVALGIAGAVVGGAIAANATRNYYYDRPYYGRPAYGYPAYGYPAYGYYGSGPAYGYYGY